MAYKNVEDRKAASKRHYEANKQKYIERNQRYRLAIRTYMKELKENAVCSDCGLNYPSYVMDFDHLSDKLSNISYLTSSGRTAALKKELKKCEIVCSNCHRIRTHARIAN